MLINRFKPRFNLSPDGSAGGNNPDPNKAPEGGSSDPEGGKQPDGEGKQTPQDNREQFIPRSRFDEVNNKLKEVEGKLASIDADKKKQEESDALKRGEHEKVIATKDQEIETLKATNAESEKSKTKLQEIANSQLEAFSKTYGEESLAKVKTLLGSEDPLVVLEKLPILEELFKKETKPTGGSQQPQGAANDKTRLQQLQERLNNGELLGSRGQSEYFKLIEELDKK